MVHPIGFARGASLVSIGLAAVLAACGGESAAGAAGSGAGGNGSGGASPGGAGGDGDEEAEVPRLNGVPIGDCKEPTDDERAALGCPQSPPAEGASCDLTGGVTCSYSLGTDQGSAYQDLYLCSNDPERHWWLLRERCGEVCTDAGPQVLELDAADCASRPADTCELEGTAFAYAPSGHTCCPTR